MRTTLRETAFLSDASDGAESVSRRATYHNERNGRAVASCRRAKEKQKVSGPDDEPGGVDEPETKSNGCSDTSASPSSVPAPK